jgi:hypothetical protein
MSINIKFPGSLGRGSPSLNGVIVLMWCVVIWFAVVLKLVLVVTPKPFI